MHQRGQTTSFQVRLEIMEQASAGLNDSQIATGWRLARCGRYAGWRRRSLKRGRVGLASQMGRPATGEVEHLSQGITGGSPSLAQTPSRMGTSHAFSRAQDRPMLARSATAQSCTNRQAPQASRLDAPRSPASRPSTTTSNPTHCSTPGMANGRGIRIMRVEGVGKVSLISIVDVVSRWHRPKAIRARTRPIRL
jgi:hypothetical protein